MLPYEILKWDSDILGIKTAKILVEHQTVQELQAILNELKQQDVQLVYWCFDHNDLLSQEAANECNGILVDKKTTYVMSLKTLTEPLPVISADNKYNVHQASPELIALALESGKYSRFLQDPEIGYACFEKVYTQWIHNSCNKKIADDVLVIKQDGALAAMTTVGHKNQRGDIGLLAVSPTMHGKGYGTQLVKMAQAYFVEKGFEIAQVVTQRQNIPACRLYEKCGFHQESIQNFYHFWL